MTPRSLGSLGVAAVVACMACSSASGDVLTFDDLEGSGPFTSNYAGFIFGNNTPGTNPWYWTNLVSPFYKPESGTAFIGTDATKYRDARYEATLPISSPIPFTFEGAYFSGFQTIGYQFSLRGELVHTTTASAPLTSTPTFIASGYAGLVDSVVIFGHQGFYALDDFTYNSRQSGAVPEPATWAMMMFGVGVAGATLRYRRRHATRTLVAG